MVLIITVQQAARSHWLSLYISTCMNLMPYIGSEGSQISNKLLYLYKCAYCAEKALFLRKCNLFHLFIPPFHSTIQSSDCRQPIL